LILRLILRTALDAVLQLLQGVALRVRRTPTGSIEADLFYLEFLDILFFVSQARNLLFLGKLYNYRQLFFDAQLPLRRMRLRLLRLYLHGLFHLLRLAFYIDLLYFLP